MTKVFLIRHGESMGNAEGVFYGQSNTPLSEKGHKQAELTAQFLDKYEIDRIYSSDLERAYNTARHIADRRNMDIIKCEGLREINAGQWEKVPFIDLVVKFPKEFLAWQGNMANCQCPGGESIRELQLRIDTQIKKLVQANEGKNICLVTHATPIRVMGCIWLGKEIDEISSVDWVANASVSLIEYSGNGNTNPLLYGESAHLGGLNTNDIAYRNINPGRSEAPREF